MSQSSDNIQRAVHFFRQPAWSRLLDTLYQKYLRQGQIAGKVVLPDCTSDERRELASFLNKRLPQQQDVTVRLADFQAALASSSFACSLPDLLGALFPARPQITNPQQREIRARSHERFRARLDALANEQSANAQSRYWLQHGAHGIAALFTRYKNGTLEEQEQLLAQLSTVSHALNQLPATGAFERLALFAQRISGDPHTFDLNTTTGRLLFHALTDLDQLTHTHTTETPDLADPPTTETTDLATTDSSNTSTSQLRMLLYYDAGLLLDTISSTVAVCHLGNAVYTTGAVDPLTSAAGERILVLPLRQLLTWQKLTTPSRHIYLFENPQVFEKIVDDLTGDKDPRSDTSNQQLPTLICTAGWPSVAAIRLLNLLRESCPDSQFHYSGDFDVQGLRIATHLMTRYAGQCQFWHFDPSSYLTALHSSSHTLSTAEISALQTLPATFSPLVTAMQEQGQKAYQEGIAHLLLADIQRLC